MSLACCSKNCALRGLELFVMPLKYLGTQELLTLCALESNTCHLLRCDLFFFFSKLLKEMPTLEELTLCDVSKHLVSREIASLCGAQIVEDKE